MIRGGVTASDPSVDELSCNDGLGFPDVGLPAKRHSALTLSHRHGLC